MTCNTSNMRRQNNDSRRRAPKIFRYVCFHFENNTKCIHPINQSYSICCLNVTLHISVFLSSSSLHLFCAQIWCSGSAFPHFYRLFEALNTSPSTFRTRYGLESNSSLNSICGAVVYSQVDFCLDLWLCKQVFQQYYPISFNTKRSFYDMITDTLY